MELTTLFQTAYTVCFILAGILLATAVLVFFRFHIAGVAENLYGIKMPGRKAAAKKPHAAVLPNEPGRGQEKKEQVFASEAISGYKEEPQKKQKTAKRSAVQTEVLPNAQPRAYAEKPTAETLWMDTSGTSRLDEGAVDAYGKTGELDDTSPAAQYGGFGAEETLRRAVAAIRFAPEKKIIVVHSDERI